MSRGRGPGRGSIEKTESGFIGAWRDAAGQRHRRLLAQSRGEAERILSAIIRERDMELGGLGAETLQQRRLSEVVESYIREIETYRRDSYLRTTKMSLTRLTKFMGPLRICDIRVERVLEFRRRRLAEGAGNRTVNLDVGALKTCLRWAVGCGLVHSNPLASLKPLPTDDSTKRRRRRALTEGEVAQFIAAAKEIDRRRADRFAAKKTIASGVLGAKYAERKRTPPIDQAPMWATLLICGIRWGEAVTLRWADIDEKERFLRVRAEIAKSKATRVVPIPSAILADILNLRRVHVRVTGRIPIATDRVFLRPKGGVWQRNANGQSGRMIGEILRVAGISEIDAAGRQIDVHALRKSSCTRMLRHGVQLNVVARILGHKDSRITTAHYEDLASEDILAAVAGMPEVGVSKKTGAAMAAATKSATTV